MSYTTLSLYIYIYIYNVLSHDLHVPKLIFFFRSSSLPQTVHHDGGEDLASSTGKPNERQQRK